MPGAFRVESVDAELVGMGVAQRWLDHHGQRARAWLDRAPALARSDARALLLERIWPGTPATSMTVADLAAVLGELTCPAVPPDLPSFTDAVRLRLDRAEENRHGLLSAEQISRARRDALDLAGTLRAVPVLCHGDLLSRNILISSDRGLLAIDPNPCAGHPAYDAAQWAVRQTPVPDASERATAVAAALAISADDVLRWVGVLSAVEVCLASPARAVASLELARRLGAE